MGYPARPRDVVDSPLTLICEDYNWVYWRCKDDIYCIAKIPYPHYEHWEFMPGALGYSNRHYFVVRHNVLNRHLHLFEEGGYRLRHVYFPDFPDREAVESFLKDPLSIIVADRM